MTKNQHVAVVIERRPNIIQQVGSSLLSQLHQKRVSELQTGIDKVLSASDPVAFLQGRSAVAQQILRAGKILGLTAEQYLSEPPDWLMQDPEDLHQQLLGYHQGKTDKIQADKNLIQALRALNLMGYYQLEVV